MNWKYVVSGVTFLVLAVSIGASDYVSTSIASDGSFLLAIQDRLKTDHMPPVL